jgi:hypothetical protein
MHSKAMSLVLALAVVLLSYEATADAPRQELEENSTRSRFRDIPEPAARHAAAIDRHSMIRARRELRQTLEDLLASFQIEMAIQENDIHSSKDESVIPEETPEDLAGLPDLMP